GTAANIGDIYRSIAGELKTVAGANTQMNLSFQNVNVTFNNLTSYMNGRDVFDYQYIDGTSTYVTSWNTTVNPLSGYPYTLDQRSQWNSDPAYLYFAVGNISINQTWQSTFRLVPKVPGSISIFGPGSIISFNGTEGLYSTSLPDTFITAIENMTEETATQALVDVWITNTSNPDAESLNDFLDVYWVLNYTGNHTVRQDIYYQFSADNVVWPGGSWIKAGTIVTPGGPVAPDEDNPFHATIDIRGKSGWMKVKLEAKEQIVGGGYDEDVWPSPIQIGPGNRVYIKIT
ncbi:MAG: hypothetical protein QHG99_06305, partial [Methanomicrobiales archaeon]|nr:hypothetical protein [Methanomicrobiales archaeon]